MKALMTKTVSETTAGPVPTPPYFYDGSILLAEKVGNQIQKIYINDGTGIIGMVRPIYDGSNNLTHYQRLYYLYDSLGSVSAVTGEHGLPLQNYTYSPYGTCVNVVGDPINNLQFVGRYGGYLDNDTGLTYFWHRWYDSRDGRWISRDPIGIDGGINLYGYVENMPLTFIDYLGFCSRGSGPVGYAGSQSSNPPRANPGPKRPLPPSGCPPRCDENEKMGNCIQNCASEYLLYLGGFKGAMGGVNSFESAIARAASGMSDIEHAKEFCAKECDRGGSYMRDKYYKCK